MRGSSNGLTNHPGGDVCRGLLMHAGLLFVVVVVVVVGRSGMDPGRSGAIWGDPGRSGAIRGDHGPQKFNPEFSRTAKNKSKVPTDRNNSIQSPHGPQKNNPKSSRTATIQSKVLTDHNKSIQSPHGPQQINPKSSKNGVQKWLPKRKSIKIV